MARHRSSDVASRDPSPRGGDQNFASSGDIVDKFEQLAVHGLPKKRVADSAELAALMVKP